MIGSSRYRLWHLVSVGLVFVGGSIASAQEATNWAFDDPADFAMLRDKLYTLPDFELVHEDFPRADHTVAGRPTLIAIGDPTPKHGIVKNVITIQPPDAGHKEPTVIRFPAWDWEKDLKIRPLLNQDLRRMVWNEGGDIYRATFDWDTGEITDKQQVTELGVFQHMPETIWAGNTLYLNAKFDEDNPVVRLDLLTGEINELPTQNVLDGNWEHSLITNPAATHAVRIDSPIIWIMDLRTSELTLASLEYEVQNGDGKPVIRTGGHASSWDISPTWLDDYHLIIAGSLGGDAGVLDVRTGQMQWLTEGQERIRVFGLLPGHRYADAGIMKPGTSTTPRKTEYTDRIIIDLTTGQHTTVDVPAKMEMHWLNDHYGVYENDEGGLTERGWWVYDRKKQATHRFTTMPIGGRRLAFSPKHSLLIFTVHQKGSYTVDINGDDPKQITDEVQIWRLFGEPLQLGLTDAAEDPWRAAAAREKARGDAVPMAKNEELIGVQKVWAAVKDESPELREEALDRYQHFANNSEGYYYDPVKLTEIIVEARKANPDLNANNLLLKVDWRPALSRDRAKERFKQQLQRKVQMDLSRNRITAEQAEIKLEWMANYVADYLYEEHPETGSIKSVRTALVRAPRAYEEQAPNAAPSDDVQSNKPAKQADPSKKDTQEKQEDEDAEKTTEQKLKEANEIIKKMKNPFNF